MTRSYVRDGAEIYRRSFATIRAEADLAALPPDVAQVAVRMIHACGQVDLVDDLGFSPGVVAAARTALQNGAPILCDAEMVASGVTRARLPAGNDVVCTLRDPRVPALAARRGHHPQRRRAGAVARPARRRGRRDRQRPDGAVPPARHARRRRAPAGRGPRHPGRVHRGGGVEGGAGGDRPPVPRRPRPPRRVRHHGGGAQRAGLRGGESCARRRSCDHGAALRRRCRPRRPRARHGQGRPPHPRRRRDRLPLGAARPLDRPAHRRPAPARRSDRGGARLPGHHRDHRSSRAATRARSTSSTPPPRSAWPPTSTPGATSSCSPRATRSSTAPTCTCTSGWPTATRPRSCRGSPRSAPRRPPSGSRWWSATRCSRCCPAPCRAPSWPAGSPTPTPRPS